jgi:hypothetical protein
MILPAAWDWVVAPPHPRTHLTQKPLMHKTGVLILGGWHDGMGLLCAWLSATASADAFGALAANTQNRRINRKVASGSGRDVSLVCAAFGTICTKAANRRMQFARITSRIIFIATTPPHLRTYLT